MKNPELRILVMIIVLLCTGVNMNAQQGQENADALLENYLRTGFYEYLEKINEYFPDSPYSMFCEAY